MAKYITLDNLGTFLGELKEDLKTNPNDYLDSATESSFGLIKVVGVRSSQITTMGTSSEENRYYGIELDETGKAFVNVPWTDTTGSNIIIGSNTYHTETSALNINGNTLTMLPADTSNIGGIKVAKKNASYSVTTATSNISSNITTVGKYYGVELDKTGKAFVYVPWTDTKVTEVETAKSLKQDTSQQKLQEGGDLNNAIGGYKVVHYIHEDDVSNVFACENNNNSTLWIGNGGDSAVGYTGHQLGFSSNGEMYHRSKNTSAGNWSTWKKVNEGLDEVKIGGMDSRITTLENKKPGMIINNDSYTSIGSTDVNLVSNEFIVIGSSANSVTIASSDANDNSNIVSTYGLSIDVQNTNGIAFTIALGTVYWANGESPVIGSDKLGKGLWEFIFNYIPSHKAYTATFAKYS